MAMSDNNYTVLISSRQSEMLDHLTGLLAEEMSHLHLQKRCVNNGHIDPLHDLPAMPDLLILHLSERWEGELQELAHHSSSERPPTLVIGDTQNPEVMRLAMKAGARDFLTEPVDQQELIAMLQQLEAEKYQSELTEQGNLTAVINAKGGSGASMLACNLAHLMQVESKQKVILMDLDMQFGSLAQYLDLKPENGVSDALKVVDELDNTALAAYIVRHKSGLQVLGATTDSIRLPNQTPEQQINQLLDLLLTHCNQLVVDLPRMIDRTALAVLKHASKVIVVVQQDFINIKDATHMLHLLRTELGIANENILVVVNRFNKNSEITLADIKESLKPHKLASIPNDYRHVLDSLNKGEPLLTVARRSSICQALNQLQDYLVNDEPEAPKGLINNLFSRLTGG
ncbi:MAG: AAA family ATPase [Amphritea sp.]|nr:AAA family ATPase [Amphritea sp.]